MQEFFGVVDVTCWKNCVELRTNDKITMRINGDGCEELRRYDGKSVLIKIKDGEIVRIRS